MQSRLLHLLPPKQHFGLLRRLNHFDIFNKKPQTETVSNKNTDLLQLYSSLRENAMKKSKELLEDVGKAERCAAATIKLADEALENLHRATDLAPFIATLNRATKEEESADRLIATTNKRLASEVKLFKVLRAAKHSLKDDDARFCAGLLLADFDSAALKRKMLRSFHEQHDKVTSELHERLWSSVDYALDATALQRFQRCYTPTELMRTVDPRIRFKVQNFLSAILNKVDPILWLKDEQLRALKVGDVDRRKGKSKKLEARRFYTSKMQNFNRFQEISSYFSLRDCMQGVSKLLESLYGVKLQPVGESEEPWVKLAVVNSNDELMGHVYCDFFSRKTKPEHEWQVALDPRSKAVLVCLNLKSTLLSPWSVSDLFHEMGRAVHSIVNADSVSLTAANRVTDYSEVPGALMEHFARDPRVLKTFARHHRTGEAIGQRVLDLIAESYKGEQVARMHLCYDPVKDRIRIDHPGCRSEEQREAKFYAGHVLSRAIASRVWRKLFKKDPFDGRAARAYRGKVKEDGKKACEDLLGEKLCPDELVRTLVEDFCDNNGFVDAVTKKGANLYEIEYDLIEADDKYIYY